MLQRRTSSSQQPAASPGETTKSLETEYSWDMEMEKNRIKYVSTKFCGYMRTTYSKVSLSCSSCMIINIKSNSCKDHRQQHLWYHQLDFIVSWQLERSLTDMNPTDSVPITEG